MYNSNYLGLGGSMGGSMGSQPNDIWDAIRQFLGEGGNSGQQNNVIQPQTPDSQNNPWVQGGQSSLAQWLSQMNQMKDPQGYVDKIMGGYSQSPWAKQQQQVAQDATLASNAASGLTGSGAEKTALQDQAQRITSADQQNYLNSIMNSMGMSLGAAGQLSGQGMDMQKFLDQLRQQGFEFGQNMNQRQNEFNQQLDYAQNASDQSKGGSLLGAGVGLLGNYFPWKPKI